MLRGPIRPLSAADLADREAVCELCRLYAFAIDRRDEEMLRSVFAPDAIIEGSLGQAPMNTYLPKLIAGVTPYQATQHNIINQFAIVNGDSAEVWSKAVALHMEEPGNGRVDLFMGVQYRDECRRTDAGWLISARRVDVLWMRGPLPSQS
jgi:hypothetical protein